MKLKQSQLLLATMVLLMPTVAPLMKHFEVLGLVGWMLLLMAFTLAASAARSEEKKFEGAAK